jgi:hypothetical protein
MAKHQVVVNLQSVCVELSETAWKQYQKDGYVPFNVMYKVRAKLKEAQDNGQAFIESIEEV